MKGFLPFLLCFLIKAKLSNGGRFENEDKCGIAFTNRIIGGKLSDDGKYPWHARLGYKTNIKGRYKYLCGGTLINKRYVITAAHCLDTKENTLEVVRLGETSIVCATPYCTDPKVQQVFVKKSYGHPQFSTINAFADIAVLELGHPVRFTDTVRPICLINRDLAKIGSRGIAAGFGMENYITREKPDGLKELVMTIVPGEKCRKSFPDSDFSSRNFICAGGRKGEDTCNGDSGGPLMQVYNFGRGPRMYLFGVISFGSTKCGVGVPGIFTSVYFHWNWIMGTIEN